MTNEAGLLVSVFLPVYLYRETRLPFFNSKPAYFTFIWPPPSLNAIDVSVVKYEFVFQNGDPLLRSWLQIL